MLSPGGLKKAGTARRQEVKPGATLRRPDLTPPLRVMQAARSCPAPGPQPGAPSWFCVSVGVSGDRRPRLLRATAVPVGIPAIVGQQLAMGWVTVPAHTLC